MFKPKMAKWLSPVSSSLKLHRPCQAKRAFKRTENAQIQISLRMRKVSYIL